ncbi:hypothetical protein QOT17_010402 [Balamuthia mandrillaris]
MASFLGLPPELQLECLKWVWGDVPGRDWFNCCLTCRTICQLGHDDLLWRHFCNKKGLSFTIPAMGEPIVEGADSQWKLLYKDSEQHVIVFHPDKNNWMSSVDLFLSPDKLTVSKQFGFVTNWRCRSRFPWFSGIHYFEVTPTNADALFLVSLLPVSVAQKGNPAYSPLVGKNTLGWSLHPAAESLIGDVGAVAVRFSERIKWEAGHVIGVYLDVDEGHLLYFWDQHFLVGVTNNLSIRAHKPYYASVNLSRRGVEVKFNFSSPMPPLVRQHIENKTRS